MYFFTIEQSMRESMATKPLSLSLSLYIYTDAPDINMLTNVFFLVGCILLNQIPGPQMNPDVSSNCFPLSALYQHQIFNYTDILW